MSGHAKKILVIDDDFSVREVVGLVLSTEGYEVISASEGETGIALAKKHKPDAIILDVSMPKMSGYLVASLIAKDPTINKTPILLLTGRAQMAGGITIDVPCVSYKLDKPFDHEELIEVIGRIVKKKPLKSV
ncbi:MAG: response regulator [bacterium]|nr:response regulator [bacterium]